MSLLHVPWILCLVLSAAPYIASDNGDVCKKVEGSACSCMFPNGTGIDLSSGGLNQGESYSDNENVTHTILSMETYYFHPCKDIKINATDSSDNTKNCEKVAICRRTVTTNIVVADSKANTFNVNKSRKYEGLGETRLSHFTSNGRSIVYENVPSATTIQLVCTPDALTDTLHVDDTEPNAVVLTLYSRNACLREIQPVSHRSTGSTLLIIFFTLVLFYLLLGVCTKKFLMGAQGVEVIPNLSYWKSLPGLCRDGWMFLRNGCRVPPRSAAGPTSPDPNSYDSI